MLNNYGMLGLVLYPREAVMARDEPGITYQELGNEGGRQLVKDEPDASR